ncbi:MAG: type II toxin-antitoxin system RelE/ParE family toxin [Rhodospirillaceae bacterium]|nr:type II toxin-antitoxin system RelE/ParE family toxin [Rhodospirillaceae bacterium]
MSVVRQPLWLSAARKRFQKEFPAEAQTEVLDTLAYLAAGLWPADGKVRWMTEIGPQAIQVTTKGDKATFRTVAILKAPDGNLYVIAAFKKKSKSGIATPKEELDVIRLRYAELMRELKKAAP